MIAVAGAGAWGTALANVAASRGHEVVLWTRDPDQAERLAGTRENARFLPGIRLHDGVRPTTDLAELGGADCALLATPAQTTRAMAATLRPVLPQAAPLVLCAKGL